MFRARSRTACIGLALVAAAFVLCAVDARASDYTVIEVRHRPAGELLGAVRAILSPTGTVIVDTAKNALIVMDEPAVLEKVEALVAALDSTTGQVRLTVTFFETTDKNDADILIRWRFSGGGFSVGNYMGIGGREGLSLSGDARALTERGISTTTQQLLVMSGGSASFITGRSVPVRGDVLAYLSDHGVIVKEVVFREVMTGFLFTPTILGRDVLIQIAPVMSYFTDEGKGSVVFYEAATTVTAPVGQTVVITRNDTDQGKFVGNIFSGFTSSNRRGSFYISITPNIVD
jgi:type II secretory pathway component GspD/PulD (secretin)